MATSGVTSLSWNLNQVIEEALDVLQVAADGESLSGDLFSRGKSAVNMLLKGWQTQGIHLWTYTEGYMFVTKGQAEYDFGTARLVNSYTTTKTSQSQDATDTTITVDSDDGISNGDTIGVLMTDNTLHWTTVNGAPASNVITLTAALPTAVNSGARVFAYDATVTFKPVERVLEARYRDRTNYDVPMNLYARSTYFDLPNKDDTGAPIIAYYSRQIPNGKLYLWNAPDREDYVITFTYERRPELMTRAKDTFDLPEYWMQALVYNLALHLAPRMGVSVQQLQVVSEMAQSTLNNALTFDTEVYDWRFSVR